MIPGSSELRLLPVSSLVFPTFNLGQEFQLSFQQAPWFFSHSHLSVTPALHILFTATLPAHLSSARKMIKPQGLDTWWYFPVSSGPKHTQEPFYLSVSASFPIHSLPDLLKPVASSFLLTPPPTSQWKRYLTSGSQPIPPPEPLVPSIPTSIDGTHLFTSWAAPLHLPLHLKPYKSTSLVIITLSCSHFILSF